jgi:hypothetical protein
MPNGCFRLVVVTPLENPSCPRELWDSFQMTHFFIQSLTIPMRFTYFGAERIPGSIFLFDLKTSENPRECFNFRDDGLCGEN